MRDGGSQDHVVGTLLRNKWTGDMLRKQNYQDLVIDCMWGTNLGYIV